MHTTTVRSGLVDILQHLLQHRRNRDDDQLFAALPTQLRLQLALCQKKPLILNVKMFNNLSAPCTVAIVSALTPRIALDGEYVLVQGRPADAMFFIRRGVVQVSRFVNLSLIHI